MEFHKLLSPIAGLSLCLVVFKNLVVIGNLNIAHHHHIITNPTERWKILLRQLNLFYRKQWILDKTHIWLFCHGGTLQPRVLKLLQHNA